MQVTEVLPVLVVENDKILDMEFKERINNASIWEVDNPKGENYFLALLGIFKDESDELIPPTPEQIGRAVAGGDIPTHNVAWRFNKIEWARLFLERQR